MFIGIFFQRRTPDISGEEKQQMQQEGSHWDLCLSPVRGEG